MEKRKTRGIGIRTKILFPTSIAIVLLCVVMGTNSYLRTKESLIAMGVEEAQMAATIVNPPTPLFSGMTGMRVFCGESPLRRPKKRILTIFNLRLIFFT